MDAAKTTRRRKHMPAPSSNLGASTLCAWPVAAGEWRIQSRNGTTTRYLRGLKLHRCAWAVCGGHLTIWRLEGTKADADRTMRNAIRFLLQTFTEKPLGDLPRRGVFID